MNAIIEAGMSPNEVIIARCNRAFFIAGMIAELRETAFQDAACIGQHRPVEHTFVREGYAARMVIDATDLYKDETFLSNFSKSLDGVGRLIRDAITGRLNELVQADAGIYRLHFRISGYWTGKSPDDGIVEDPTRLPMGENLSRQVELRIGYAV